MAPLTSLSFSSNTVNSTTRDVTLAESQHDQFNFTCSMRISSPVHLRLYRVPSESSLPAPGAGFPTGALVARETPAPVQPPEYGVNTSYSFELAATRANAGTYWCEIEDSDGVKNISSPFTVLINCMHYNCII